MVMAETQKSPESVRSTERSRAQRIRQDSAACVSLSSIYLSKSAGWNGHKRTVRLSAAPSLRKRSPSPSHPGKPRVNPEIACPLPHTKTWRAEAS